MQEILTTAPEYSEFRFFSIRGRSGRLHFMASYLILVLVYFTFAIIIELWESLGRERHYVLPLVYAVFLLYPHACIISRRLHDIGLSAWCIVLFLMLCWIIGSPALLVVPLLFVWPGSRHENTYGPPPLPDSKISQVLGYVFMASLGIAMLLGIFKNTYPYYMPLNFFFMPVGV